MLPILKIDRYFDQKSGYRIFHYFEPTNIADIQAFMIFSSKQKIKKTLVGQERWISNFFCRSLVALTKIYRAKEVIIEDLS